MKPACAALSVDMANPSGVHGYISNLLNEAARKCYEFAARNA
jgi:hypothetical protein